ncbi:MAG TPA: heterodisulfide reductase-related iron-sulfur binding cluster [Solirubrobacteraceae bacterium]|jgi:glycolate oxidase iron-sulfur subunit
MTAFDQRRPPEPEVIADCVHCGFCLDACPTYQLWGQEADSPRGRIVLIAEGLKDGGELSPETVTHFDRCLGCMACVTACPSGVRYDRLIERVRPQIERNHRRTRAERAVRKLLYETLPHPRRLQRLAPLLQITEHVPTRWIPEALRPLAEVAPKRPPAVDRAPVPEFTAAVGERRGSVALLLGCVQRVYYPQVHQATVRVLAAEGYDVLAPALPDCCGALELHGGAEDAGMRRARRTIDALTGASGVDGLEPDHIVVNAAGCGSAMKGYGELLGSEQARRFSARVRDVNELLGSIEPRAPRGPLNMRVVYHDACHLAHAQGIRREPRELLGSIPGLELLEVTAEGELCCGSAGIYNLVQPEAAAELGERKARHLLDTGAEAIAAANPGCTAQLDLHLRRLGRPLPVYHPIELLARSIGAP